MSVELTAAQDVEMFAPSLSSAQQRELAEKLTTFLSQFSHLSDSFIIVRIDNPSINSVSAVAPFVLL